MIPPIVYAAAMALLIGAFGGWKITSNHYDAQQLTAERQHQADYRAAVERGNEASNRLLAAETQIRTIATWKGKQIETVDTNRPCLSSGAIGLLNETTVPRIVTNPGSPLAASPSAPTSTDRNDASDTDVIRWAIESGERYETCAARLTALQEIVRPQAERMPEP